MGSEYDGTAYWQTHPCLRCNHFHPRFCPDCWGPSPTCADHECSWPEEGEEQ